jgi:hypothetical protein
MESQQPPHGPSEGRLCLFLIVARGGQGGSVEVDVLSETDGLRQRYFFLLSRARKAPKPWRQRFDL